MQDEIKRLQEELNEIDTSSATQDPSINVGQVTGEEVVVGTKITYYVNQLRIRQDLKRLLALLFFLLVTPLGFFIFWPNQPERMTGEFNIAVAEFFVIRDGEVSKEINNLGPVFYQRLNDEIQRLDEETNIRFSIRKPAQTGVIVGDTAEERASQAKELAEQINAQIVIYGTVVIEDSVVHVSPEFFVSANDFYRLEEIVGQYRMGSTVEAGDIQAWEISQTLSARAKALSLITIGFSYYVRDDHKEALNSFEKARYIDGWHEGKEILYGLLGYSALKQGYLDSAQAYCEHALDLNSAYARSYICLGNVFYHQALKDAQTYEQVDMARLDSATDKFLQALEPKDQPPEAHISTRVNLALGQAYLVKAQIVEQNEPYLTEATDKLERVVADYNDAASQDKQLQELASHAYAHLGLIHRLDGKHDAAIPLYEQAVELTQTQERKRLYAAQLEKTALTIGALELANQQNVVLTQVAPSSDSPPSEQTEPAPILKGAKATPTPFKAQVELHIAPKAVPPADVLNQVNFDAIMYLHPPTSIELALDTASFPVIQKRGAKDWSLLGFQPFEKVRLLGYEHGAQTRFVGEWWAQTDSEGELPIAVDTSIDQIFAIGTESGEAKPRGWDFDGVYSGWVNYTGLFTSNDLAKATEPLSIHVAPSSQSDILSTVPTGTYVRLRESREWELYWLSDQSPISNNDLFWWYVKLDNGLEGWVAEPSLELTDYEPNETLETALPLFIFAPKKDSDGMYYESPNFRIQSDDEDWFEIPLEIEQPVRVHISVHDGERDDFIGFWIGQESQLDVVLYASDGTKLSDGSRITLDVAHSDTYYLRVHSENANSEDVTYAVYLSTDTGE